jgi:hypothetical protein
MRTIAAASESPRKPQLVKPSLAEARGLHAQPLGHSDPRGASPLLWGSRHWQNGQPDIIPSLAVIGMVFFRAIRSDAKSDVRKGKAFPLAGSNPFDATRRNACAPLQAFAAWIASRRLFPRRNGENQPAKLITQQSGRSAVALTTRWVPNWVDIDQKCGRGPAKPRPQACTKRRSCGSIRTPSRNIWRVVV